MGTVTRMANSLTSWPSVFVTPSMAKLVALEMQNLGKVSRPARERMFSVAYAAAMSHAGQHGLQQGKGGEDVDFELLADLAEGRFFDSSKGGRSRRC